MSESVPSNEQPQAVPPLLPAQAPAPAAAGLEAGSTDAARPINTLAIVSLVSAFLVSIAGIVTGHIALSQIRRTGERGRGLAVGGLVVGYAGLVSAVAVGAIVAVITASFVSTHSLHGPVALAPPTASQTPPPQPGAQSQSGPQAPSAAQQQEVASSCAAVADVLGQVNQADYTAVMADPTTDAQKTKTVVSALSAGLNAILPETSGSISMLVSSAMEGLDAETNKLNRYIADPSGGTDDVLDSQFEAQADLSELANGCAAGMTATESGPQTKAAACAALDVVTAQLTLANDLRKAKDNVAQIIAAVNGYANLLERGIFRVTNPDILAAAKAAQADVTNEAKALKAFEDDPSAGTQGLHNAEKNTVQSAQALDTACTP
jgi:hypothetical protein